MIKSTQVTLDELVKHHQFFQIPIYQRLYVWEEEQVVTLLEDIKSSYAEKKSFYLGSVLVVENQKTEDVKVYDLIDGQQRFTTLWMIAIVFSNELAPFISIAENNRTRNRIHFAIREEVNHFFSRYISTQIEDDGATEHIKGALAVIENYKRRFMNQQILSEIASFIYKNVYLIMTEVPQQTDLNKLFEVINNRGVQLQHHEILKARLLEKLSSDEEKLKYGHLWTACSDMNKYVETNIKDAAKINTSKLYDKVSAKEGKENLKDPKKVLQAMEYKKRNSFDHMSLKQILLEEETVMDRDDETPDVGSPQNRARSIITFPMLLQHTLRIFLASNGSKDIDKILDKELLSIFSTHFQLSLVGEEEVKEFIELLWEVRYLFDKHVIKWVEEDEDEIHLICKIDKYESNKRFYMRRIISNRNEGEALLQSMLYHSQQITTHYWLTPYLNYLVHNNGQKSFEYLKHLDNHLFCSDEKESLIVRTKRFIEVPWRKVPFDTNILKSPRGVSFPHYWFYKLEFILWETSDKKKEKWKEFKITAKNSVEHISPRTQQPADRNTVSGYMINCFGNLALVSRSINSSYSNLPFNEKRQRFLNYNRDKVDSLKMDIIYKNEIWNDQLAQKHQDEMIEVFERYLRGEND
ncbi:DUF262 domain-containing protein [Rossellomorea vietnamensis]|uniref:DUF262 domain-containing protein n=1 Tax=Rossellomorea vietnamensis TaxID=218284 RepID=A0A5D4K886_9BACI|nr:DUF262 domain-containing protein [Rossellomorea vietnamensis]TYR73452.1 DUF262 domain-containing protein [Rossellomorea vietnamensis]